VTASRRTFLRCGCGIVVASALERVSPRSSLARPAEPDLRHGVSLFGDLKYPPGFAHFDYVNPAAPRGGVVRQGAPGTYDNLNPVVAGLKGNLVVGLELIYETLLLPALDEASSAYCLLAQAVRYPENFSSVSYRLRGHAKWHDGRPVTPEDVLFSFHAFKETNPRLSVYYRHVTKAEVTAEEEITFQFDAPGNRELPLIVGQFHVLPKHWWEGTDSSGVKRNVTATMLEAPLGSGPYKIKSFEPGRSIGYERVNDYWGENLNVRRGCNNFDELRFDYFRDWNVAFEAFKADDFDWRVEYSAKNWATGYDFPAINEGRVVREEFPVRNMGIMQAFAFNLRRHKLRDWRLRRAFNFAFDFEHMNKEFFYGQYERIASYFQGTELASSNLPQGRELEILQAVRDQVPAQVFTTRYWNPTGGSPQADRRNLLHAMKLLGQAGFGVRDLQLVELISGEPLNIEFLLSNPGYERFTLFYKAALERLGIAVTVRLVDDVQYQNRLRQWDFDIVVNSWPQTLSPGNEQRNFWGSQAADRRGSHNLIGIKNPAVDTLIDRIVFAASRKELIAATRALDRVLLWNHYVVPQWSYGKLRTARWDRFGRPKELPRYGEPAFPAVWWWDPQRAMQTASR
jgi:microcin C transport system substrate-binding protein